MHHPRRICSSLTPPPPHFVSPEHAPFAGFPLVRSQGEAVLNRAVELYSTVYASRSLPSEPFVSFVSPWSVNLGHGYQSQSFGASTHQITLP